MKTKCKGPLAFKMNAHTRLGMWQRGVFRSPSLLLRKLISPTSKLCNSLLSEVRQAFFVILGSDRVFPCNSVGSVETDRVECAETVQSWDALICRW